MCWCGLKMPSILDFYAILCTIFKRLQNAIIRYMPVCWNQFIIKPRYSFYISNLPQLFHLKCGQLSGYIHIVFVNRETRTHRNICMKTDNTCTTVGDVYVLFYCTVGTSDLQLERRPLMTVLPTYTIKYNALTHSCTLCLCNLGEQKYAYSVCVHTDACISIN